MVIIDYLNYLHLELVQPFFIFLTVLICVDLVSGLIVAIFQKSGHSLHGGIESAHFVKGVWRKVLNLLLYVLGITFSYYASSSIIQIIVGYCIVGYEGLSLVENFMLLGFPFPKKLKQLFEVFKSKGGDGDDV